MTKLRYWIITIIIAFIITAAGTALLSAPPAQAAGEPAGSSAVTAPGPGAGAKKEASTEAARKWEITTQLSIPKTGTGRNKTMKMIILSTISVGFVLTATWIVVGKVKRRI